MALIKDIKTRHYNTNNIVEYAKNSGIDIVISSKSNRKLKRNFDDSLYFCCHIIENTFLTFKCWRTLLLAILGLIFLFLSSYSFYSHLYSFSILNSSTLSHKNKESRDFSVAAFCFPKKITYHLFYLFIFNPGIKFITQCNIRFQS